MVMEAGIVLYCSYKIATDRDFTALGRSAASVLCKRFVRIFSVAELNGRVSATTTILLKNSTDQNDVPADLSRATQIKHVKRTLDF